MIEFNIAGEENQEAFGAALAQLVEPPCIIYLTGGLGAGKTTLARGFLRGLGHEGRVKSPTFTLLEPYELARVNCYHFDLYRLADPEELLFLGIEDLLQADAVLLVEWPEKGSGVLPAPDLSLEIHHGESERRLKLRAGSDKGAKIINNLQRVWD
jgi:tRNA threonylcarbamoyladenosine biosynthesis protein TsaE